MFEQYHISGFLSRNVSYFPLLSICISVQWTESDCDGFIHCAWKHCCFDAWWFYPTRQVYSEIMPADAFIELNTIVMNINYFICCFERCLKSAFTIYRYWSINRRDLACISSEKLSTLYSVHCTLYTAHCTLYSAHCSLYTVYCIMYIVYCIMNIVHCTLYTEVQYTPMEQE